MKMKKFICVMAIAVLLTTMAIYHFCLHIDNQHFALGDNYTTIEWRLTDFFGNDITTWEQKIEKEPMEFVIYKKWF